MNIMRFTKMDGAGNDFVVTADVPGNTVPRTPEMIRAVCDRRRGIGADGLLVLKPLAPGEVKMTYFNSDGSRAEMCGNGLRCCMEFAALNGFADSHAVFHTDAGRLEAWRPEPELIRRGCGLTNAAWRRKLSHAEPERPRSGLSCCGNMAGMKKNAFFVRAETFSLLN